MTWRFTPLPHYMYRYLGFYFAFYFGRGWAKLSLSVFVNWSVAIHTLSVYLFCYGNTGYSHNGLTDYISFVYSLRIKLDNFNII